MRIATYNVEWFEDLFDKHNNLLLDRNWSRRYDVKRVDQATAIADVIRRVDADIMLIVEAPNTGRTQNTVKALEKFTKHFGLRQKAAAMGYANDTHQELAVIYDPFAVSVSHDPQGVISNGSKSAQAPRFDGKFRYDVDIDGKDEVFEFSKPPIELAVEHLASSQRFRMIGVHPKSKSTYGASTEKEEIALSIKSRRKQLAQCIWIRQRANEHLENGDPLIILGDFNDGPGFPGCKQMFAHSGVEIVLGYDSPTADKFVEPHAELMRDTDQAWTLSTSRFYISEHHRYQSALLDYVMLSQDLYKATKAEWRIWHPFDDPECFKDREMREALLAASDHFPVSVDLNF